MPKNLTAVATFDAPVAVPVGSDARTASSVETPLQQLTNRGEYLQQLCEVTGVARLKEVVDLSTLAAIDPATVTTGALRLIPGVGVYRFITGAASADFPFCILAPGGTSRWEHVDYGTIGTASGVARLTSGSRLVQLPSHAIIAEGGYAATSGLVGSNSTTSYTDVAAMTLTVGTAAALDVLRVYFHGRIDNSGTTGTVRVVVTENGGSDIAIPGMTRAVASGTDTLVSMCGRNPVTTPGTLVVKVQLLSSVGGTPAYLEGPSAITYELVRP